MLNSYGVRALPLLMHSTSGACGAQSVSESSRRWARSRRASASVSANRAGSDSPALRSILRFQAVEHGVGRLGLATGTPGCNLGTQGFNLQLPALLALFQQTQARANHLARIVEAPHPDLIADEFFEVTAQGNTGWHGCNPDYLLTTDVRS